MLLPEIASAVASIKVRPLKPKLPCNCIDPEASKLPLSNKFEAVILVTSILAPLK